MPVIFFGPLNALFDVKIAPFVKELKQLLTVAFLIGTEFVLIVESVYEIALGVEFFAVDYAKLENVRPALDGTTFDFGEYMIRPGSDFTKESVWKRMHDENPQSGAVLFAENNHHILLLHAHDETEEMLPEYYKQFIDHLLENGLVFDEPKFL